MNISEQIIELIKQGETVELNGIGTFESQRVLAHFDANDRTFYPTTMQMQFSTLRHGGVDMVKIIAEKECVGEATARQMWRNYLDALMNKIEGVGSHDIAGIGTLRMTDTGMVFEPAAEFGASSNPAMKPVKNVETHIPSSTEKDPFTAFEFPPAPEPEPVVEPEPVAEPEPVIVPEPVVEAEPETVPEPVAETAEEPAPVEEVPVVEETLVAEAPVAAVEEPVVEEKPVEETPAPVAEEPIAEEPIAEEPVAEEKAVEEAPVQAEESVVVPVSPDALPKEGEAQPAEEPAGDENVSVEEETPKKKKRGCLWFFIILLLVLLLGAGGAYYYFFMYVPQHGGEAPDLKELKEKCTKFSSKSGDDKNTVAVADESAQDAESEADTHAVVEEDTVAKDQDSIAEQQDTTAKEESKPVMAKASGKGVIDSSMMSIISFNTDLVEFSEEDVVLNSKRVANFMSSYIESFAAKNHYSQAADLLKASVEKFALEHLQTSLAPVEYSPARFIPYKDYLNEVCENSIKAKRATHARCAVQEELLNEATMTQLLNEVVEANKIEEDKAAPAPERKVYDNSDVATYSPKNAVPGNFRSSSKQGFDVIAGFYVDRNTAARLANSLKRNGCDAYVIELQQGYYVSMGSRSSRTAAEALYQHIKEWYQGDITIKKF